MSCLGTDFVWSMLSPPPTDVAYNVTWQDDCDWITQTAVNSNMWPSAALYCAAHLTELNYSHSTKDKYSLARIQRSNILNSVPIHTSVVKVVSFFNIQHLQCCLHNSWWTVLFIPLQPCVPFMRSDKAIVSWYMNMTWPKWQITASLLFFSRQLLGQ